MTHFVVEGLLVAVVLTTSALAQAQEAEPDAAGKPAEAAPAAVPAPTVAATSGGDTSSAVADGGRFRFGVAGGVGFFTAASEVGPAKVSCTYYGVDLRFGAQINDMFGVYAQPTLGYYTANG